MRRWIVPIACLFLSVAPLQADDKAFPEDWFNLGEGEAGIVFMIRAYAGDFSFDVKDENGATVDSLAIPKGKTAIVQYRVPRGAYPVTFFDKSFQGRGQPGFFAAMGIAVTYLPAADGKPESFFPDFQPFATYTVDAVERRLLPLVGFGPTDIYPPKALTAKQLDFEMTKAGGP